MNLKISNKLLKSKIKEHLESKLKQIDNHLFVEEVIVKGDADYKEYAREVDTMPNMPHAETTRRFHHAFVSLFNKHNFVAIVVPSSADDFHPDVDLNSISDKLEASLGSDIEIFTARDVESCNVLVGISIDLI